MIYGYARASQGGSDLAIQIKELHAAGCEEIVKAVVRRWPAEPVRPDRLVLVPADPLCSLLEEVRPGDVVVVCRLDRLGRPLSFLVDLIGWLDDHGVSLRSLAEPVDTGKDVGGLALARALAAAGKIVAVEQVREAEEDDRRAACGDKSQRSTPLTLEQITRVKRNRAEREKMLVRLAGILGVDRSSLDRATRMPYRP